jgi:hypothetical protein
VVWRTYERVGALAALMAHLLHDVARRVFLSFVGTQNNTAERNGYETRKTVV